ncbi:synthase [Biscogniauxia sp. FL1348]|nr:synthase [Biscogniauxia sp. FL1348]
MSVPFPPLFTTALRCAHACARARTPITATTPTQPISRALSTTAAALSQPPRDSGSKANSGGSGSNSKILLEDAEAGFAFARHNPLPSKPRTRSVTEIRGPYYTALGPRYLADPAALGGAAGARGPGAYVSTGGWVEHVLASRPWTARAPSASTWSSSPPASCPCPPTTGCASSGASATAGSRPSPSSASSSAPELAAAGTSDPGKAIGMARRFVDAGVERVMIESEGITENVQAWRTDVIQDILRELPMEKVMFEAADPAVFNWYIREFGVDVNLFVDHSQIVQLAGLRAGIWGKSDTFGKITTFRPPWSV